MAGHAQLGNVVFRLDPDDISYPFQIDYSVIDTLGGQVIQVLGATTGDLTVTASLGEDRKNAVSSWQLAEDFQVKIKRLIDSQTNIGTGQRHRPIRFTYHDGVHDWDFMVLIKSISDPDSGGSIGHSTGKFSYRFTLTLFIVEESSLKLKKIATDKFISRISNGMGWKATGFNGSMTTQDAIAFIQSHSSDGTFSGYVGKILGATDSTAPGQNPTTSGGAPNTPVSGNEKSWIQDALTIMGGAGVDMSKIDVGALEIIINGESGGDPHAQNNKDANAAAGHPSKGLMQTIDSTFNSYALPNHTDIWNPVDNIIAGCRYAIATYGSLNNVPGVIAVRNNQPYVGY